MPTTRRISPSSAFRLALDRTTMLSLAGNSAPFLLLSPQDELISLARSMEGPAPSSGGRLLPIYKKRSSGGS